jgi:hypothetical protein
MVKQTKNNKRDLRNIFLGIQKQMIERFTTNRDSISHPTKLGDSAEINWIEMFNQYLPKRYTTTNAQVIDSHGDLSDQIDVVIFDRQYSPLLFSQDGTQYIPAESVYAVFEVKQELNKKYIIEAGKKAESVRKLKRTSSFVEHVSGTAPPKIPFEILSGILTLDSSWKPALGKSFKSVLLSLPENRSLNFGCCLKYGAFEVIIQESKNIIKISSKKESLISFFLRLIFRLQKLGTVPALDIEEYMKLLK